MAHQETIMIRDATYADVDSMTTIIPRAYAPNAFLNKVFKDGPPMRKWWNQVYTRAIADPRCRILVASDDYTIIGVMTLMLWRPTTLNSEADGGICTLVPLTEDHDELLNGAMEGQVSDRRAAMGQQANFMVDLLGVDVEFQGRGVGERLVRKACEIADEEAVAMYLQTTAARKYYVKLNLGFEVTREFAEHGVGGVLVRHPRGTGCIVMS